MVPPDPNSVTGLEMQTMPMQKRGCGMKKYGARQNDPKNPLKEIGEKVGGYILGGATSLLPASYAASALVKAKEHFFSSENQAKGNLKSYAQKKLTN